MDQRFKGVLRGNGLSAECVVTVDSGRLSYMSDDDVKPQLPDGEYQLEVNGVPMRAIRSKGKWHGEDY